MSGFDYTVFDGQIFGGLLGSQNVFDVAIFDSGIFDTGDEVEAASQTDGGGTSRKKLKRRRPKYWSDLEPVAQEVITAVAVEQVARPAVAEVRQRHLAVALKERHIEMATKHLEALNGERERLIVEEVSSLMRRLQESEDDAFVMALAEAI
jgi:hypothetical protein